MVEFEDNFMVLVAASSSILTKFVPIPPNKPLLKRAKIVFLLYVCFYILHACHSVDA